MTIQMPRANMLTVLRKMGQLPNLKLLLDAGDAASYDGSSQNWIDLSGTGSDFFRGLTTGAEASDPTFNGNAGRNSSNEYFSFDGADYFNRAANPTWVDDIHKDNAKLTLAAWIFKGTTTTGNGIFGNLGSNPANTGFQWSYQTSNTFEVYSGTADLGISGGTVNAGWNFLGVTMDEAIGALGGALIVNAASFTFTSTYTAPSAGASTLVAQVGSKGNAVGLMESGHRMASMMAWTGRALNPRELLAIFEATRSKFNI